MNQEIIHVWSDYDRNDDDNRRHQIAKSTWPMWIEAPMHDSALARDGTSVGASRRVPFLKDLINHIGLVWNESIIVLTNSDTCVADGICDKLRMIVPKRGAVWSSRRDFPLLTGPIPNSEIPKGERHPGADLFAFTPDWWLTNRDALPDFLLCFEMWDLVLKTLITETGGGELLYSCYHAQHQPHWFTPEMRECQGNLYNRKLGVNWIAGHELHIAETIK